MFNNPNLDAIVSTTGLSTPIPTWYNDSADLPLNCNASSWSADNLSVANTTGALNCAPKFAAVNASTNCPLFPLPSFATITDLDVFTPLL